VVEALLQLPIWRKRLARLAGRDISDVGWARLCALAALHDIGKLNIGFQAKGRAELGTTAGHVTEALGALFHPVFSCLSELSAWGDGVTGLLVAAICHHGRPYNSEMMADSAWQATWWTPRAGLDPRFGAVDLLARCRSWFPTAFEEDGSSLPETSSFSHAFAGLVMLADWMGSDTRFFRFSESGDGDRMNISRLKAREAVTAMALDFAMTARSDPSGRDPFVRIAPAEYRPRAAQTAALALPHDDQGSITVLEAETGSGKTEAALARFVSLFEAGLVDGLYFALPTRSAATQMHRRVHAAAQQAFAKPPAVILAVPGYLRVDDVEGTKLAPFEVLWPDHERFRYRAWASENTKRYLVGCIVVGTVDQVLLSSLMVGHAHLRAAALLRHLLVVDEVHASDAYMARILEDVLARHRTAGGHALLLSATLGGEARTRLLHPGEHTTPPTIADAEATPYPLITHRGQIPRAVSVTNEGASRVIAVAVRPYLEDPDTLASDAFAAALRGAKVLVIKNTVNDCVATHMAIERLADANGHRDVLFSCSGVAAPHHARFARADREALDIELEKRIGKERSDGGCVVVATQTVQQSLDLDADILFSDLCPADVLLQRIGRLHRHDRARPAGFEQPRTFVMVPELRDLGLLLRESGTPRYHHGLGSVYPDMRILEATWRLLEMHQEWRIPTMNRHLVENSLHSDVLGAIAEEGGTRWQAHAGQMIGATLGQRRQADLNLVDWLTPYGEMSFPSAVDERIMTRLGEGDRRVRFQAPSMGPFRQAFSELVLRAAWASGTPSAVELAEQVASKNGVTRFVFGQGTFVYDRLGLRPDKTPAKEVSEDDGP
jgi:CRISPR-associated endonuclease/helicase Cas3